MAPAFAGHVEIFHLLACPEGLTQECEAGLYRRITAETPDVDTFAQLAPAIPFNQASQDLLKGDAVQWILRLLLTHISTKRRSHGDGERYGCNHGPGG